jgi:hypothetical protein
VTLSSSGDPDRLTEDSSEEFKEDHKEAVEQEKGEPS